MDKGQFVYRDTFDNELCLFIFIKLNHEEMKIALPNSHDIESGDYFVAIIRAGTDYLGQSFYSGIEKIMQEQTMFDLELDYESINIDNFSKNEYNKYKEFSNKKFAVFNNIQNVINQKNINVN